MIVQTSTVAAVVISAFHRDAFTIAHTGQKASESMRRKLATLLITKYGKATSTKDADGKDVLSGGPSFEAYREDHAALKALAAERKLKDNQYVRKAYAHAVKATYGALPVSMDAAAVLKRAQRDAAAAAAPAATVGAPAGETQEKPASESEQLEQLITRIGVFKALEACIAILAADDSTKGNAVHMKAQAKKAAEAAAKANKPAANDDQQRKAA